MSHTPQLTSSETLEQILFVLSHWNQPSATDPLSKCCDSLLATPTCQEASSPSLQEMSSMPVKSQSKDSLSTQDCHHPLHQHSVECFLRAHHSVTGQHHSELLQLLLPHLPQSQAQETDNLSSLSTQEIIHIKHLKKEPSHQRQIHYGSTKLLSSPLNHPLEVTTEHIEASQRVCAQLLIRALYTALGALLSPHPDLKQLADELHEKVSATEDLLSLEPSFHQLFTQCDEASSMDKHLLSGLRRLLDCASSNIARFDEHRFSMDSQVAALKQISGEAPLTLETLKNAEVALMELSALQSSLKENLLASRRQIKELIRDFISQIATDAGTLDEHTQKMDDLTQEILSNDDLPQIRLALDALASETRGMASRMQETHQKLAEKEQRICDAQVRIDALQKELAELSQKVKEDALTGALNRRGLEEIALRDISLACRGQQCLSLALLDLDDFKRFNDELGHAQGDQALRYLVSSLKRTLRPSDSIARFGGEEFVLLLSHSSASQAAKVLQRAQESLTDIFTSLSQTPRKLSFSAGITQWGPGDDLMEMIKRADELMYQAKKEGKSRVCFRPAPPSPPTQEVQ